MTQTSDMISLQAEDGHQLQAWLATPAQPRAGVIVLQEIFGLTQHIKAVTDAFAAAGYLALAPAMFDRVRPGIVLDYTEFQTARDTMSQLTRENCVRDIRAAASYLRRAGKVGIVGFCWGGSMADLAACHGLVDAGVSYYGRMTIEWLDLQPACPMLYHYGEDDPLIPPPTVQQIAAARTGAVHVWAGAGHGFNCADRPDYRPDVAKKANAITQEFLARHLD